MFNKSLSNGQERIMNDQLALQLKAFEAGKKVEDNGMPTKNNDMPFEWPNKLTPDQRILLGVGLQEIRRKKGFTQDTLSRRMGIDKQMICAIEGGKRHRVKRSLLNQFGHHLQTDMHHLMQSVINSDRVIPVHQRRNTKEHDSFSSPPVNLGKLAPVSTNIIAPFSSDNDDSGLIFEQDFSYRLVGDDFQFKLFVSKEDFKLEFKNKKDDCTLHFEAVREPNSTFVAALKKIVSLIQ